MSTEPLVVQIMREHKAGLLRREQSLQRDMAQQWLRVEQALLDKIELLARDALVRRELGQPVDQEALFALERYQSLLAQVRRELSGYTDQIEVQLAAQQQSMGREALYHAKAAIEATGLTGSFDLLPIEAVEALVGLAGDGSPLRTLLERTWPDGVMRLTDTLIRNTALGINPRRTAREMADGMTATLDHMLMIARTEQLRAYREMTLQQYAKSGVVRGFRRLATRDRRTCAACLFADGELYEGLDTRLRTHVCCRCTMVPVVVGMPALNWQKGMEWFKVQNRDVQQSILGPGRYAAWKQGTFDLRDVVKVEPNPIWGDSIRPRPLRELV